jgi:asparagine synthase (glutamine-hydrolysing)
MLDHGFLSIASRLRPESKAHSRFLSRLQLELDPALGRLPLDGRPAPIAYARPSFKGAFGQAYATGLRVGRKALQKARRMSRPPAGGDVLARKVIEYWRERPQAITAGPNLQVVREEWVSDLLAGKVAPRASAVALLVNLVVAGSV